MLIQAMKRDMVEVDDRIHFAHLFAGARAKVRW